MYNRHEGLGSYEGEYPDVIDVQSNGELVKYAPEDGAVYSRLFLRFATVAPGLDAAQVSPALQRRAEWIKTLPALAEELKAEFPNVKIKLYSKEIIVSGKVSLSESLSWLSEENFMPRMTSMIEKLEN